LRVCCTFPAQLNSVPNRGVAMLLRKWGVCAVFLLLSTVSSHAQTQQPFTWQQVRAKFDAANANLRAGQLSVDEARAQEITAHLRPNPTLGLLADQINPFSGGPAHSTFGFLLSTATVNYLHERAHKRELRTESAQGATKIAESGQADLHRTL